MLSPFGKCRYGQSTSLRLQFRSPNDVQECFSFITSCCTSSPISLKETPFGLPDTSTISSTVAFSPKHGRIYNEPHHLLHYIFKRKMQNKWWVDKNAIYYIIIQ